MVYFPVLSAAFLFEFKQKSYSEYSRIEFVYFGYLKMASQFNVYNFSKQIFDNGDSGDLEDDSDESEGGSSSNESNSESGDEENDNFPSNEENIH